MSKCTRTQALEAFEYWLGYYEKASGTYAKRRDKAALELDKGANNYTYAGHLCGVQGGAWCAMMVSTALYEACGGSRDRGQHGPPRQRRKRCGGMGAALFRRLPADAARKKHERFLKSAERTDPVAPDVGCNHAHR